MYVPLSDITLFKNNVLTHQVELCFVHAWYTTSVGKQPLHAFKLARGLPFRTEMSSTVYPRGCGWERDGSTCTVRAPLLFVHVPNLRGCVRERYKPRHNAPSMPMPPPSPTTSHHPAPLLLTLSLTFLPTFLYTRDHYQNYNLQIYKATNCNRCNINGVCVVVLAKEDINYPLHACGSL